LPARRSSAAQRVVRCLSPQGSMLRNQLSASFFVLIAAAAAR
jgi:hypothetical protein